MIDKLWRAMDNIWSGSRVVWTQRLCFQMRTGNFLESWAIITFHNAFLWSCFQIMQIVTTTRVGTLIVATIYLQLIQN